MIQEIRKQRLKADDKPREIEAVLFVPYTRWGTLQRKLQDVEDIYVAGTVKKKIKTKADYIRVGTLKHFIQVTYQKLQAYIGLLWICV